MSASSNENTTPNPKATFAAFVSPNVENIRLYRLYVKKRFEECKFHIETILAKYDESLCESQILLRAKIAREEANIRESIMWLEKANRHNPRSVKILYEMGKNHYMLAEHHRAIELFAKALERESDDWRIFYWQSLSYYHVFRPPVCMQKARLLGEQNEMVPAVAAYKRSIEMEPENVDLIYSLGMLYLKSQSEENAFAMLGKALTYDPGYVPSILAIASVLQAHGDYDVALSKYKIAATEFDHSAALWNNIAMCYFGKGKLVAAISCLNRANYFCPLDWKILFNLSLVYFALRQFASAYHFISAAFAICPQHPLILMTMAVILTELEDFRNAKAAYKRASKLNPDLFIVKLNFAIFEYRRGNVHQAIKRIGSAINETPNGFEELDHLISRLKSNLEKLALEDMEVGELLRKSYAKEFDGHMND
ncbi:bardet-Biedl syndrome 4 protein [Ditylenchus destructor]|uniref:Bardet-Biedl syndrome 4 protein n=1 Tax=Ditylenchus destructor TaxID=166010 RepID=A0AAD4RC21_9BILA|nr:bardet-Biedl syndrome 4 protein [Ditylenchus destructor]